MEEAVLHVGVRGEVEDEVLAGEGGANRRVEGEIGLEERRARVHELAVPRREVVDHRDVRAAKDQRVDDMASDEPGPSGHDDGSP